MEAWLTSAVADGAVNKAIVLAGSLRRVRTAKKLAVLTTSSVSKILREKLKKVFDLVVVIDPDIPNGWKLEDYAKVEGFFLMVFNKCVYLSSNILVLRNCDEIFDTYGDFAAFGNENVVDSSVYLFKPSLNYSKALGNMVTLKSDEFKENGTLKFGKWFGFFIRNNVADWEKLDERYNVILRSDNDISEGLGSTTMAIVNFGDLHPLDMAPDGDFEKLKESKTIKKFALQLCERIFKEDVKPNLNCPYTDLTLQREVYQTEPIAIVGLAFRLPGCNTVAEFWDLLDKGKEAITVLPESRWSQHQTYIAYEGQDRKVEGGFLTVPVDEFDAKFFGISGKEAELLDPQHRILHEVAWEALEDAMIDPISLRGTQTGVFVGSWLDDYKELVNRDVDAEFFRVYMGNSIGTGAARLSHFLEVTGPSIATESGCSSAVVAVDMACKSLRNHDSNLALACGVNLILKPFDKGALSFVVSPDGRCKTFDEGANGFGRAEGCAVLIMKRLSDAVRDENNIWGLIRGSAVTQEGLSKSLGTPTVHCESLAMELALKDAQVHPLAVSYVEAHGTGTPVGDPMEIAAIAKAYSKGRSEPLVIGSVKTNVGHTESVSGITGIIKVLLSMKNEKIPEHLNLKRLNPAINLNVIPAKIPLQAIAWRKLSDKPRIAGVSSFGITGTDGHVIIQEPPVISLPQIHANDERPLHILKVSAKSPESFQQLLGTYDKMFSEKENDDGFADLAYSANVGRATFNHRAVIIAKDFKDAKNVLRSKTFKCSDVQSTGKKLCFLFTGQGSQYPNMAATLYKTSPIFRDEFNKCDQFLTKRYGINLKKMIWNDSDNRTELSRTLFSQTSIFSVEYCLLRLWESWGVKPDYVMGHSLGEFTAAVAAGILDFEDALMLVAERSSLIDSLPRGKMLVIQTDKTTVVQNTEKFQENNPDFWVDYAALNTSTQTVVAGDSTWIEEFAKYCEAKSLKTTVLAATHAFHSRHMEPMLELYRKIAHTVKSLKNYKDAPKYISGMDGKLVDLESIDADYWVQHSREPVNFIDACKVAQSEGCSLFLEVGPHPVLSAMTMMNMEGQSVTCLPSIRRKQEDWVTMMGSLAQLYMSEWKGHVDWNGVDSFYKRSRVCVPFYPFNRKPVWKVIEAELPMVHPLVGKIVPTDCDHSIFESRLTLKKTPFLQDHVIGNTIVFPGAAFLEMCLVGGHLAVQNVPGSLNTPQKSIVLQSLKIITPLAFDDSKLCRLQTSSELGNEDNDEISYSIRVARHVPSAAGGAGEWILHASAKFHPVPAALTKERFTNVDIPSIRTSWKQTDMITAFYERLPEVGLRFGPKFQSLETGWESEKGMLFAIQTPEEDNENSYLIHPIVADAMIQATMLWTSKDKLKMKLQVPVQIGEFRWLQASTSASRYIYCTTNKEGKTACILLDAGSTHLAHMSGVDFMETSVKLVEGMIRQQAISMPNIWGEVWKSNPGSLQSAYDLKSVSHLPSLEFNDQQKQFLENANDVGERERSFFNNTCEIARLYFLNAMHELGWAPKQMMPFTLENLLRFLPNPKEHLKKYFAFFLNSIADSGMIVRDPDQENKYYFAGLPPTHAEIQRALQKITDLEDCSRVDYQMVAEMGRNLSKILLGKVDALHILFSNGPNKPNADKWRVENSGEWNKEQPIFKMLNDELIIPMLSECYDAHAQNNIGNVSTPVLRVLEVGSGTGAFTKILLGQLQMWGKSIEYHYTDISASFFQAAEKKFAEYSKSMIFKKFNMEEDPLAQGFCPRYFDMIVAYDVLHVAKNIRKTLKSLQRLLKPGGIFQISECTDPDPRVTQIFGLLEGYWQFEDLDIRPNHATLTPERWEQVLKEINCDKVICTPVYNHVRSFIIARLSPNEPDSVPSFSPVEEPLYSWVIFFHESNANVAELLRNRLVGVNRKVYTVKRPSICTDSGMAELMKSEFHLANEVESLEGVIYLWGLLDDSSNRDQSQISLPFINLVQEISEYEVIPRLYVVTQGTTFVDGSPVTDPTAGTLHGLVKSVMNENLSLHLNCLDLCPDQSVVRQVGAIFHDLWWTDQPSRIIAYRDDNRLCSKLVRAKVSNNEPLALPSGCTRFQLELPNTRLISDLEFGPLENYTLSENEVEVKVKATALNFRDVFAVLKPIAQFEELNTVGLDFAGVVTKVGSKVANLKVGDRVIGMNLENNLSLPSHIKIEEPYLIPITTSVTFEEGATLPVVFSTAVHCLLNIAKMKRGDTVLIHTASGGVGLSAIQLAQRVGAEIIVTAGSKRKQTFLRNLGIKHVFHSRTTHFGREILELTNGRGVDIVLNSITGDGFKEASLAALAQNGRFIEMSKLKVWRPEEVKEMRPDVFYEIVDLMSMDGSEIQELFKTLKEFLETDYIRPIPYERFDAVNIRGALNYLQKAKHIGKIVCVMPEVKIENSKITSTTPLCNEFSTYFVTGGLGGIGFEVVKWMLNNGAKHIAIASRSHPKPEIASQIESWNRSNKHVEAFSVDVGDYNQCEHLFQELRSSSRGFPQIRGIMHAAGVLADATLENQTWSKYRFTYNPKVDGTWNLHDLTKDLPLEHFVVFSSVATSLGSPGQSNHAASNSFEDSLAAYRRSNGLPATAVNWGNWGEIGIATEVDIPGIRPITTSQGMLALETFLKTQMSHLTVINVQSFGQAAKVFPRLKDFVEDKSLLGDGKANVTVNSDEFWRDVDNAEDRQGKLLPFKILVKSTMRNVLKMGPEEEITDLMDFQALGIDSLMMLELKNGLQNIFGSRMSPTASQLKDCSNTEEMANQLVNILHGEGEIHSNKLSTVGRITMEELGKLVREDSILPQSVRPSEGMSVMNISEVGTVLLTGVTGVLGPYILRELSHRPNIKKIYCLIRKLHKVSPMERLLKRLHQIQLADQVNLSKVECIQGDVTEDKFGLSEGEYNRLGKDVDAIFNNAVRADHTANYFKATEKKKLDMRTVNVKGTVRILEFAVHTKLKHVYHASSLLAVTTTDEQGCMVEDWQDVGAYDQFSFNWGYPLSKHISEQLCRQAVERGIPCKTFRHPVIGGDSKTGRCDYVTNHFVLRWLTYLKLKCMPDAPIPLVAMPVDHCAEISLDIFFNSRAPYDVYNIAHKDAGMDMTIITIAEQLGIDIQLVSFSEFVEKLNLTGDDSPIAAFQSIYEDGGVMSAIYAETDSPFMNFLKKYLENSATFFGGRKLAKWIKNYEELESTESVIRRDMTFLKDSGIFDKFGIQC